MSSASLPKGGAISLLFRQTNIVWVAFVAAQALIDRLRLRLALDNKQRLRDPLLKDARPGAAFPPPSLAGKTLKERLTRSTRSTRLGQPISSPSL